MNIRKRLAVIAIPLIITLSLAACGRGDSAAGLDTVQVGPGAAPDATPPVTLDVVMQPAPADCGAEAAITFAQAQNDLALAAVAAVNQAGRQSQTYAAQVGVAVFAQAYARMADYAVPDCLALAHEQAQNFFQARIAGYQALLNDNRPQYDFYLDQGEQFRRAMIKAVDEVLSEQ